MKKAFILLSIFCLSLSPYIGSANCSSSGNNASCNAYDTDYQSDQYYIDPTDGLTFYLIATVDYTGPQYSAYSSISWSSSGPVNFYEYYPGASYSPYYYDAYAQADYMTLVADSKGAGSHAYVTASW
ncbi:hypothetical protein ACFQZS_12225 [Mucilaginibacter calamicampi]|uniref:Uncharacterized protein n=1 Tax=Mucilaginibacter calamicampi TaxID=1302352 RepID=A0ABW2YZQ3_9SPHI